MEVEQGADSKGTWGIFWGDGTVIYLQYGGGYTKIQHQKKYLTVGLSKPTERYSKMGNFYCM